LLLGGWRWLVGAHRPAISTRYVWARGLNRKLSRAGRSAKSL